MTNISNEFKERASGFPDFEIQGLFSKLAGVSDGYTNSGPDMSLNSTLESTPS